MKSIELHLIETARDVDTAIQSGLVEPDALNGLVCMACSDEVGHLTDLPFAPFAVILDERDIPWFLCGECVSEVIDPSIAFSVSSVEELFATGEEFDELDYEND